MKDMLAKIIEIDKNAQKITDEARQEKIKSTDEINLKKKEIKNTFLSRAEKQIQENRVNEENKLKKETDKLIKLTEKKLKAMQQLYDKNCSKWVNTIVKMTVEG